MVSESPLFKYLVEYDNIDARVGQEVEAADLEILLSSTFGGDQLTGGVHTGDFIIFTHPDDGTQIIKEILGGRGQGRITSVSGTVVNVNNVSIYKLGDKIKLVSSTDIFKSIIVSITDNSLTLNDAIFGTFSNGDHALIEVKGSPAYITLESATGVIIPNGSEVLITRISASDDSSNNKAWSSDGVTYITTSWSLTTTSIPVNNVNWIAVGCWIEINEPLSSATWAKVTEINEARNTITVATDVTFIGSNKPTINVYWAPDSDNFIEIPQSGFNARIVDDGDPPVDPLFKAGDVFTISTDGLVLKDDSKSRKVSVSLTSKAKHGKLDFPTIKNRFISPTFAEILTRNLLDFYKWPKYHLNLPMYHLPFIDFVRINRLASFKVISGVLFPFAKDFTRRFYLRSMTIDMKKNVAGLTLVDKDAY